MQLRTYACLPFIALFASGLAAQPFKSQQIAFFEKKVRPLLAKHCFECHSTKAKKLEGDLRLDHREGFLQGGASGKPVALPGSKLGQTRLFQVVRLKQVGKERTHPPLAKPLSLIEIKSLAIWVQMKLPFPKARNSEIIANETTSANDWKKKFDWEDAASFWAFKKPANHKVPQPKQADWAHSDIDRFILDKQEATGLHPVADAPKTVLLRRLYFDLIGLPPSRVQMKTFLDDDSGKAFEKVVDELLASHQFGERWGRHWMDVARYAESTGMERNFTYPHAWRYRDYVIKSFNEDKPFDRFVLEQIAGDLLPPCEDRHEHLDRLKATGFLTLASKGLGEQDKEKMVMDVVEDQIDVLGRSLMGLTLACARCHDHKFDPISIEDYYGLAGIFRSTVTIVDTDKNPSYWPERPLEAPEDKEARKAYRDRVKANGRAIENAREEARRAVVQNARMKLDDYLWAALRIMRLPPPVDVVLSPGKLSAVEELESLLDVEGNDE